MAKTRHSDSEYRCERKFCTPYLTAHDMECILRHHPALFREVYPSRWVNNCYLETPTMESYLANLAGVADRVKTRLRWYGELFGAVASPTLELKIKSGNVGRKRRFPLVPFTLDHSFCQQRLRDVLRLSCLPEDVRMDASALSPMILNRYKRKYFESTDRRCRVTLDTQMHYYGVGPLRNSFAHKVVDLERVVVELKYPPGDEHYASGIAAHFPIALSRNSKYANGVKTLYSE